MVACEGVGVLTVSSSLCHYSSDQNKRRVKYILFSTLVIAGIIRTLLTSRPVNSSGLYTSAGEITRR